MDYIVIIAYFNGKKYFQFQLESIINQSIPPKKIIVIDDNSNDKESINQVNKIPMVLNGIPIVVNRNEENQGPSWTFIKALGQLQDEDLIFLADQDDIWDLDKVMHFFNTIKKQKVDIKKPFMFFSDLQIINEKGIIEELSFFTRMRVSIENLEFKNFFKNNYIPGCSMAITGKMSNLLQKYDYNFCTMHDHVISLLSFSIGNVVYIKEPLVYYRSHGDAVTLKEKISLKHKLCNLKFLQSKINSNYRRNYLKRELVQLQEFRSTYRGIIPYEKDKQLKKFLELDKKPFLIRWLN